MPATQTLQRATDQTAAFISSSHRVLPALVARADLGREKPAARFAPDVVCKRTPADQDGLVLLLVPQRHCGVEPRGAPGRIDPGDQSNSARDSEAERHRPE